MEFPIHFSLLCWTLVCVRAQDSRPELRYTITEELPQGHFVGNILEDSNIKDRFSAEELEPMHFRFLGEPEESFTIDEVTGIIQTGSAIDRDGRCPGFVTCFTKLDVVALTEEPMALHEIIKIRIEITDINDNFPVFVEPEFILHILESATAGSSYLLPTAIDPDSGKFTVQKYEVVPPLSKFVLEVNHALDGSTEIQLKLTENLDREKEDLFNVRVIAYDGGNPPKSSSMNVLIFIQDTNDNNPEFENSTYIVNIPENLPIQSSILTVEAKDEDSGLYGEIIYHFSERTMKQHGHLFRIENTTGEIIVTGVIDYEQSPVYHLSVIAKDRGPDSFPAETAIIVQVEDSNDHSPAITLNTLSATGTDEAMIAEDAALNTFVAHLVVMDEDSGQNGNVSCQLNDNHFKLEYLDQGEYKIVTRALLDRESHDRYNLAINCKDQGLEPQVSVKHVHITVTDVNDNSPVFNQESYHSNLMENNIAGAYVGQIRASDQDMGDNAVIRYRLLEDIGDYFNIDSASGNITAATIFDHEKGDYRRFHVLAIDNGNPANTGTAMVVVHITDQNDARPLFTQSSYSFGVLESEDSGTEVGVVAASDSDGTPNNIFTFSLFPSTDVINNFDIEPNTGRITTKVVLDREVQATYYVVILATDVGVPPLSSSVTATVHVSDINDNIPTFTYPSLHNNTVYISNDFSIGHIVTKVMATDLDIGNNAKLFYYFSEGNEEDIFSIDPWMGDIKLNMKLDHIEHEVFELFVAVKDHGIPQKTAVANINIVVNNSHEFFHSDTHMLNGSNLTIVIAVASGLGLVMIILIIAILIVLKRHGNDKIKPTYNCQIVEFPSMETQDEDEALSNHTKEDISGQIPPISVMENHSSQETSPDISVIHVTEDYKYLGVHQSFRRQQQDQDADSAYSGESSNTDSGRGLSEEGDGHHRAPYFTGSFSSKDDSFLASQMEKVVHQTSGLPYKNQNQSRKPHTAPQMNPLRDYRIMDPQKLVHHNNHIHQGHYQNKGDASSLNNNPDRCNENYNSNRLSRGLKYGDLDHHSRASLRRKAYAQSHNEIYQINRKITDSQYYPDNSRDNLRNHHLQGVCSRDVLV